MTRYLRYLLGHWRLIWGFCPVCNSDAPEIDSCAWCGGFHGWRSGETRYRERVLWQRAWNARKEAE